MTVIKFEDFDRMTTQEIFNLVKDHAAIHIEGPLSGLVFDVYTCIFLNGEGKPYIDAIVKVARNDFIPKNDEEGRFVKNLADYVEYKFYSPENIVHNSNVQYGPLLATI